VGIGPGLRDGAGAAIGIAPAVGIPAAVGVALRRSPADGEAVDQRPVGEDHDLVADGLPARPGVVDGPGRLPGGAAVHGAGEPGRALLRYQRQRVDVAGGETEALEPVPGDVDPPAGRVGGVGGDRFLVVEGAAFVAPDGDGLGPGGAAVRRAADQDGGVDVGQVDRQAGLVDVAVGGDVDPGVGRPGVVAAVGGGPAGAAAEGGEAPGPVDAVAGGG